MRRHYLLVLPVMAMAVLTMSSCGEVVTSEDFEYYGMNISEDEDTVWTIEDGDVSLSVDLLTTNLTFKDADGREWNSIPTTAATSSGSDANNARSNLILEFSTNSGITNTYNSYAYSVEKSLYEIEKVDTADEKGFNLNYTIGNINREYTIPYALTATQMQEYVDKMDKKMYKKYVRENFREYDINKLRSTDNKEELLAKYPELANENMFVLNDSTPEYQKSEIEKTFEEAGYTQEEHEANKEKYSPDKAGSVAVFNITLQVRIENNQLVATVPFDQIAYTTDYIPIRVDVLPYFGASTFSDNGYMIVPDGCGAQIDFNNGKVRQSPYNSRVYGWDDSESRKEVVDDSVSMFAGFGIVYNEVTEEEAAKEETIVTDDVEVVTPDTDAETDTENQDTTDEEAVETQDLEEETAGEEAGEEGATDGAEATDDAAEDTAEAVEVPTTVHKTPREAQAFLCLVEDGNAYASIEADISGRLGDYNYCFASYNLIHYIDMDVSAKSDNTVRNFEKTLNPEETISQRYIFTATESYVTLAESYREYLLDHVGLEKKTEAEVPVVVEAIGAVDTIDQVAGVPTTVSLKLTSYKEATAMVTELKDADIENLYFKYNGWFNGGVENKPARNINLIQKLGSATDFKKLVQTAENNDVDCYLSANFNYVYRDKWYDGYSLKRDSAKFIGREICELTPINNIWFGEDDEAKPYYLTKPSYAMTSVDQYVSKLEKYGAENVAFEDLGYRVNADYNPKKAVTRQTALEMQVEKFKELQDAGHGMIIKGGNDFTLEYADVVTDMWIESKMYNIENRSIPFYQIAVHGLVEYTGPALNLSDDYETSMLRSVETGAGAYFTVISEPVSVLGDSEYTNYYGAEYALWKDTIVELGTQMQESLGGTFNQFIVDHVNVTNTVAMTQYEDGTKVIVNYGYSDYTYEGYVVGARDYIVIGGGK